MPVDIPQLPASFWEALPNLSLAEIGIAITKNLLGDSLPAERIEALVDAAIDFPAPLVPLRRAGRDGSNHYILELFHGPSLAFKDFGARFMAGVMNELLAAKGERLIILVATSGDTGGAVAAGFHGSDFIDVIILYPKGAVSDIQEAQLTTLGGNVSALRVDGTFDDCQAMVKQAFVDEDLRAIVNISSANSINISRLIPQSFYYVEAYRQWLASGEKGDPVFCVPSGNFGNLTAGLLAERMGLPVHKFIAATNANDTVTRYANSGTYAPKASVRTISNAMDVGAPSNFARMEDLFGSTWNTFKESVYAVSFDDKETERQMANCFSETKNEKGGYVLCPHTAVGLLALDKYQAEVEDVPGIVLGTAHPGKFLPDVERVLACKLELPEALETVRHLPREMKDIGYDYDALKAHVLNVWADSQGE
jgi:threonine synthase